MTAPTTISLDASPGGLMRLYYRIVFCTVTAVLFLHGLLRFSMQAESDSRVGPLVLVLDSVLVVLALLGLEIERTGQGRSQVRGRLPILVVLCVLLVMLCFETGGIASPYFLLVVMTSVFAALTQRARSAVLITALLGVCYSFAAWASPRDGFLHGGLERIQAAMRGGRTMPADEVTALCVHCAFLFVAAWIAMRLSAGYRAKMSKLQDHALRDVLTGLPNRRAFEEKVRQEIERAQRFRWPIAILIVDLDHFKRVNDQWGHAFGDAVLGQAAKLLRESAGPVDHLARLGGEEFAVAAVGADPNHGAELAARIVRRFRSYAWETLKAQLKVTCSIGVSVLHPGETELESAKGLSFLLEEADQALYRSKEGGRDRFEVAGHPVERAAVRTTRA